MIAKISSADNLGGILRYNFRKVEGKEATIITSNHIYTPEGYNLDYQTVFEDFVMQMPQHCRCKKPFFHCSLNPDPKDKVTDEQLEDIAKEYMTELGYGDQPFIVFKHNDIDREHIHIVSLNVDRDGRKINDSFQKRRSKQITDMLELKYGLHKAEKALKNEPEKPKKIRSKQGNISKDMGNSVAYVLKNFHFQSLGEYNAILKRYNITAEISKTDYKGKVYEGIVYCPLDDNGNKVANPIKASKLGRGLGISAVKGKMGRSKVLIKEKRGKVKAKVLKALYKSPKSIDEFKELLKKENITCEVRYTEQGKLYGITFVDDKEKVSMNGSRLGKQFSANTFEKYFSNPEIFDTEALFSSYSKENKETYRQMRKEASHSSMFEESDASKWNDSFNSDELEGLDYIWEWEELTNREGVFSSSHAHHTSNGGDLADTAREASWRRKLRYEENRRQYRRVKRRLR